MFMPFTYSFKYLLSPYYWLGNDKFCEDKSNSIKGVENDGRWGEVKNMNTVAGKGLCMGKREKAIWTSVRRSFNAEEIACAKALRQVYFDMFIDYQGKKHGGVCEWGRSVVEGKIWKLVGYVRNHKMTADKSKWTGKWKLTFIECLSKVPCDSTCFIVSFHNSSAE